MLWTIAAIMLVLWVLGLVSSYTLGGFIHLLLVAAIVLVAVRLIQGRSVTSGLDPDVNDRVAAQRCARQVCTLAGALFVRALANAEL